MANLKGSIGGFFFKQEEKEEDKNEEVPVPREFVMESKSDSVGGNCLLTRKQPENLKDIPIMEEIEPTESENEDLSSSKVSSIPHEPDAQSVKSQDDESDKNKTVCSADDTKKSFNLDKELNEIEFIISNLFGVLGELSESVGCSKNIQEMKVELDTIQQSASNLGSSASSEEDIASTASSLEKTVLKAKACGADLKQCPVSEETFDKMVASCQQVGVRLKEISPVVGEEEEMQETLVSEIAEPEEEGTNSDNAILSKEKTEGIGKLETAVIEERVPSCQAELKASGCESTDESSRDDKYHFNTPPSISTESEIQACGITPVHSKGSRDAIKEDETEEDEEPSSDYKLPEASSGMEKVVRQMALDSGTDDQASSGTFSQDDMSPRFADLPQQLDPSPQLARTTSAPITANDPTTDNFFKDVKAAKADRTLSMETRTTSAPITANDPTTDNFFK